MYISIGNKSYKNESITEIDTEEVINLINKKEEDLLEDGWVEVNTSKFENISV